jgi:hypothetical protein
MRPNFDERDQEILNERELKWNEVEGPRVGDFIQRLDRSYERFSYDYEDGLQTTIHDGSFYFGGGGWVDFSGTLQPKISRQHIELTDEIRDGTFWFFHHAQVQAENGVWFKISCRVYKEISEPTIPDLRGQEMRIRSKHLRASP